MAILSDDEDYPFTNSDLQIAINDTYAIMQKTMVLKDDVAKHIRSLLAVQLERAKTQPKQGESNE